MMNLKQIDDGKYVFDFFKNISRRKEIPIIINCNNEQIHTIMLFRSQKDNQLVIATENMKLELYIGLDLEIHFFYQEIYYFFPAQISGLSGNRATIQYPSKIFTSFKRLLNRYKIESDDNAYVMAGSSNQRFRLRDINTKGLSLIATSEIFPEGARIRDLLVEIEGEIGIQADAEVKHISRHNNGHYVYGLVFVELDWAAYHKLFNYIFRKSYPDLKSLSDFTMDELSGLYEESRYISLKPKDDEDQYFMDHISRLEQLNYKPEIAANLIYLRNGKLLSVGSVIRLYDRTFFGQQLLLAPDARLNPKAKTDIYIGLADFMLNHPYCEYYLTYVCNDTEWHQELFNKINERINDRDKFSVDSLSCFECNVSKIELIPNHQICKRYHMENLEDPAAFLAYAAEKLSLLEIQCYRYVADLFELSEIKGYCQSFGLDVNRKVWRLCQAQTVVAYIVAEAYPDVMNPFNAIDTCRVYFMDETWDIQGEMQLILIEVNRFFVSLQKQTYKIIINGLEDTGKILEITGLTILNDLVRVMANREGLSEYKKLLMVEFKYFTKYYPLTYPQKGIWYTEKMYPGTSIGNITATIRIKEKVDYKLLERAINLFIEKNDAARLHIVEENEALMQYVVPFEYTQIEFYDFSKKDINDFYCWEEQQTLKPIDLKDSKLTYFALIQLSPQEGGFYVKFHHTMADAWTMNLFAKQTMKYYSLLKQGITINSNKLPSYFDYIQSEEGYKFSPKFEKDKHFWKTKFETIPEFINYKNRTSKIVSSTSKRKTYVIQKEFGYKLQQYCIDNKFSVFTLFASILFIYFHRVTLKDDIVIGTSVLNRSNPAEKETVGMFISTIPFRQSIDGDKKLTTHVHGVSKEWATLLKHQKYPYELILKEFRERHKVSENLYDVMLSYQNAKLFNDDNSEVYTGRWHPYYHQVESLNIHINDREDEGQYILNFDYLAELFDKDEIDRMHEHLINILEDAIAYPGKKIYQLEILSEWEKRKLLYEFNDTESEYPKEKTIDELFEEQVAKTPERIAVVYGKVQLSYKELNQRANQLAWFLHSNGVSNDNIVGIMIDRSIEMVVCILAVLKAGGAYLPIDPEYPEERINFILEDSKVNIVITRCEFFKENNLKKDLIIIDVDQNINWPENFSNLRQAISPYHLAYIIYTSGTTGKPKGVMIEHRNVVRLFFNNRFLFNFNEKDIWTLFHSFCFDFSVWELFGALLYGGKLIVIPQFTAKDVKQFLNVLQNENVTILNQTPTAFYNLVNEEIKNSEKRLTLRYIILGGEALKPYILKDWRKRYPDTKLINMYGITETTVHVTFKEITQEDIDLNINNIGKPIPTLKTYIMDKNLKLLPMGVPGELYVSGAGVARGYLNRPALTAEKFIMNPDNPDERLYKSGDLARILSNGDLEYLGRVDNQVKINGHRIEIGEIESQLLKHDKLKAAIVIDREDNNGNKNLCVYFVADEKIEITGVKQFLANNLPAYMIPSYFVQINEIPVTVNGKINKSMLPEPEKSLGISREIVAPQNEIEEALVQIWMKILTVKHISVDDSFFNLGGDSIKAINLINLVEEHFKTSLRIIDVYQYPTIKEFAEHMKFNDVKKTIPEQEKAEQEIANIKAQILNDKELPKKLPNDFEDLYPMSDIQLGMIYASLQRPNEAIYHDQLGYIINDRNFNLGNFKDAINLLVENHPILRTSFNLDDFGIPIQIVHSCMKADLEMTDLQAFAPKEQEEYLKSILSKDRSNPFSLNKPLWRIKLFQINDEEIFMFILCHHSILDGWSVATFVNSIEVVYTAFQEQTNPMLIKGKHSYKDFVIEQISDKNNCGLANYWKDELNNYKRFALSLMDSKAASNGNNFKLLRDFDEQLISKLKNLARTLSLDLRTLFFSTYIYMIYMISYEDDFIVGLVENNRPKCEDAEKILGCFLNTVPFRVKMKQITKWNDLIAYINKKVIDLKLYGRLSLFEISKVNNGSFSDENPFFDTIFNFVNFYISNQNDKIKSMMYSKEKYDLYDYAKNNTLFNVNIYNIYGHSGICFDINENLFSKTEAEKLLGYYLRILELMINNPDGELNSMNVLSNKEKNQLLYDFNNTEDEYPKDKTVNELFEEQVERTPDNIALIFNDQQMTYRDLNVKSNQIAILLRKKGVKSSDIVGVAVKRSFDMMVGIFGILKAGAAYLPIDPEYPVERINYILNDSNVKLFLTQSGIKLDIRFCEFIFIDNVIQNNKSEKNIAKVNKPDDLIYIIYTSGSTGKPKGVMIPHRAVVNFIYSLTNHIDFASNKTVLSLTTMTFDIFVLETILPLLNGLKVVIANEEEQKDPRLISDLITKKHVDILQITPSRMQMLVNNSDELSYLSNISKILLGGETFPVVLLDKLRKITSAKIYNMYGPTETTVWSTFSEISTCNKITIGKPISNTQIYIVNKKMNIQPINVVGELCIAGDGVGKGYLNNPELTHRKFIPNPFIPGTMMYLTGDFAKWLPDGNIEFLGRIDHQVKIRGFRIELAEIESHLLSYGFIKEAVVVASEEQDGNIILCAYFISDQELRISQLREYLSQKLPDYMIPSYYTQLQEFMLTPNGKIDRMRLPKPTQRINKTQDGIIPENEFDLRLMGIWEQVMGIKPGLKDSFVESGGDSIKAISLVLKINKEFNMAFPLKKLFELKNIKEISKYLLKSENKSFSFIPPIPEQDYYPLSSAQKRIYLLQQFERTSTTYNISGALTIEGVIDIKRLEKSFSYLIKRHESLRTSFEFIDVQPVQRILDNVVFKTDYLFTTQDKIEGIIKDFIRPFDLTRPPLFRIKLLNLGQKHLLLFDMHHIISDGASINILLKELSTIYEGKELPELRIQYKDFAVWQNELVENKIKDQETYWLNQFSDEIPILGLPTDFSRPATQCFEGAKYKVKLQQSFIQELNKFIVKSNISLYMILLAAYYILLSKYSSQEDIIIGTPVIGRRYEDLENIFGIFVNTLVLRNQPQGAMTFECFLEIIKEKVLKALENQDYPFEKLIEKLKIPRKNERNPLFDCMFALQKIPMSEMKIGNLKIIPYDIEYDTSKFDLTLEVIEDHDELYLEFEYCVRLFRKKTVQKMADHYLNIIKEIIIHPEIKLADIEILTQEERRQILFEFNTPETGFPEEETIHGLFEKQVNKTPDNTVLIFNNKEITYKELNNKSNQIAQLLREKGVKPNSIVGLMVERSFDMVIGILGILKAGGAYLPIDPDYPAERIDYILKDSNVKILLTSSNIKLNIQFSDELVYLDNYPIPEVKLSSNLVNINKPDDLIYVIYTSGSTGSPKGVMIQHRNVIAYLYAFQKEFQVNSRDTVLQQASFCFDAFVEELFPTILFGAKLVIASKLLVKDVKRLSQIIMNHKISVISCSPLLLNELNETLEKDAIKSIRLLISGGDILKPEYITNLVGKTKIYNSYGPTETTVCASYHNCSGFSETIPIGKPILNYQIYIFDKYQKLCPIGIPGEVFISGAGVGKGYINTQDYKEEKFMENPFIHGGRMYKTGDLAKWLPDGSLIFLGRCDNQVKIKGYRIDVTEIEKHLTSHKDIKNSVVISRLDKRNNKYLSAYIVSDNKLETNELRSYLLGKLPEYMIPSYFTFIKVLPVTTQGKIDFKSLPDPTSIENTNKKHLKPNTIIEKMLLNIWLDILDIKNIDMDDDFFEIGGDSLKALLLIKQVKKEFNIEIPLVEVFKLKTIRNIGDYINNIIQLECACTKNYDNSMVLMKRGLTNNENLFLIHDGTGEISSYTELCMCLTNQLNCWGIQINDFEEYGPKNLEIETIASKYIEAIKRVQPNGPYNIAGWCIGGTIGFEIGRQLEQNGEKINSLILVDTEPPRKMNNLSRFTVDTEKDIIKQFFPDFMDARLLSQTSIRDIWAYFVQYGKKNGLSNNSIKKLHPDILMEFIASSDNITIENLIQRVNIIRSFINARSFYIPSNKVLTQIHFVVPDKGDMIKYQKELDVLWGQYCMKPIKYWNISGDHYSIFKQPDVNGFSELINQILNTELSLIY